MGAASQGKGLRYGRWHLVRVAAQPSPWTPPARVPGSCRRKEHSKAICVLVTMANIGKQTKFNQTVLALDTKAHHSGEARCLHLRVSVGTCVCTCGHVCASVHSLHNAHNWL